MKATTERTTATHARATNATSTHGALLAALACVLVGGSFTANSVLGAYPYAGGQFLRYGLACLLLLPLLGRGGTAPAAPSHRPPVGAARACSPPSAWSASTSP